MHAMVDEQQSSGSESEHQHRLQPEDSMQPAQTSSPHVSVPRSRSGSLSVSHAPSPEPIDGNAQAQPLPSSPPSPSLHRRRSVRSRRPSSVRRPSALALEEQREADDSSWASSPSAGAAVDPFSSFLSHHSAEAAHARSQTLSSGLGFTASLAMKKMATIAKILNTLKKSPLLNPAGVAPRSRPSFVEAEAAAAAAASASASSSAIPDSFLPHLQALAHHPHIAVLSYPASSVITHQGCPPSLVSCLVSGRVRHLRDGAVCAEMGRGGIIGADSAVFSSEGYRRWRRGQWRRRQERRLQGEAEGGSQQLHGDEETRARQEQRERNMAEDEAELGFQQEEERGRRRRRLRCGSFTSVQSVDSVECVVFPSSLLLSFLQSDRALQSHAYSQLTAVHWLRRAQWRQAEVRLQRLWGDGSQLREEAETAAEAAAGSAAVERRVLGSAGFVYWDALQAAVSADDARLRRLVHEQNRGLDHPFFAFSRGEGGGAVQRHRVRLRLQGGRDGDRDAKREMRKEREKEEKVKKVRKIIDAMDRKRRQKEREEAERQQRDDGDDDLALLLDDGDDEDEYETDDDDEGDDNPTITDARYVQAMSLMRRVHTPKGGMKSRLATPKLRMDRRLLDNRRLDAAASQAKEAGGREEERQAEKMEVRLLPMTPRNGETAQQAQRCRERKAEPLLDRSFLPVNAADAASSSHRADAKLLFAQWSETASTQQPAQQSVTAARSRQQQQQERPEGTADAAAVAAGHRRQTAEELLAAGLAQIDYGRTKQRLREEEAQAAVVEDEAASLVDQLRFDPRRVLPLKVEAGVARGAVACKTAVREMLERAEDRWGREQGRLQRILAWSSAQATGAEEKSQGEARLQRAVEEREEEDEKPAEEATALHEPRRSLEPPCRSASPVMAGTSCFSFPYPTAPRCGNSRRSTAPHHARAAQPMRPATPSPPSSAGQPPLPPRPSTAQPAASCKGVRSALLSREGRGREAAAQGERCMVDAAGNRGLGWQLRLDLLVEADAVGRREEELQRQREVAEDRQRFADVLRLETRTRRVALPLNASTVALPASAAACLQPQPQRAARPMPRMTTPRTMALYASRMAAAAAAATSAT